LKVKKGANQAVASSKLSAKTTFVGQVGLSDSKELLQEILESGCDISGLQKIDAPTG
jgi:sugar/nucleoside kinase (ribokinase family)